jgi:hypothetical protein
LLHTADDAFSVYRYTADASCAVDKDTRTDATPLAPDTALANAYTDAFSTPSDI